MTPFAAYVSFAFGDTKNLIKLSAVVLRGALVISAAVYGIELWKSPGNGPRSLMPGVVAMSGIVPAAMSFPLPFNTGSKMARGAVRTILGLSVSTIPAAGLGRDDFAEISRRTDNLGAAEIVKPFGGPSRESWAGREGYESQLFRNSRMRCELLPKIKLGDDLLPEGRGRIARRREINLGE